MSVNKHKNIFSYFRSRNQGDLKMFAISFFTFLIILGESCKKLVEVGAPITSTNDANVYASDATAISVLTGIYTKMSKTSDYGNRGITTISVFSGLSADELTLYSGTIDATYIGYYTNALKSSNLSSADFWSNIYPYIYVINSAIGELAKSTTLTPAVKKQLIGEAKFMRAFFYFYLVNLYGDVPLANSTDYTVNAILARATKTQVYQQIIADLKDAQSILIDGYLDGTVLNSTSERVRPNKWAASALLARAYLYSGDFASAEAQATAVINNSTLYGLVNDPNDVFLANSTEAIWQLQPVYSGVTNTQDAYLFIIPPTGPSDPINPVYLSNNLLNSFEVGDKRKANWVNGVTVGSDTYYYPYKYKVNAQNASVTEYLMVLRLGEQYLIRAEARAQQGNTSGAAADLNSIRTRAGLGNTSATTQVTLLTAIQKEKQVELFTEWGHRWLDLKRTNTVDAVMSIVSPQKGSIWNTNWQWYPIPLLELQRDQKLVQNAGY